MTSHYLLKINICRLHGPAILLPSINSREMGTCLPNDAIRNSNRNSLMRGSN